MNTMIVKAMSGLLLGLTLACGCAAPVDQKEDGPLGEATSAYTVSGDPSASLPAHGGGGGSGPDAIACPFGDLVVGFWGRSGDYIDQLGLWCAELFTDGSLGTPFQTSTSFGGSGGNAFSVLCPSGTAATTLGGRSGEYVDELFMDCSGPVAWQGFYGWTGTVGGSGGTSFQDTCPNNPGWTGMVLTQVNVRHGNYIDQIQGVCTWIAR